MTTKLARRFFFDGAQAELGALPIEAVPIAGGLVEMAYIGALLLATEDPGQGFFAGDTRCAFVAMGEQVIWGPAPLLDFTSVADDDGEILVDDDAEPLVSE